MSAVQSTTPVPSIFTPGIDLLLIGGISIALIFPIVLLDLNIPQKDALETLLLAVTVINGAHFMASYRLLYSSYANVRNYPWATIYVPGLLLVYIFLSANIVGRFPEARIMIDLFLIVVAYYLAIHYTGQTWGMMASFAHLRGTRFNAEERRIFKLCLALLAFWQVVWSTKLVALPEWTREPLIVLETGANWLLVGTIPLAGYAFWTMSRRNGKAVPIHVLLPFANLYLWYALIDRFPAALVGVQISHAIQYLPFTLRVEINRSAKINHWDRAKIVGTMVIYLFVMLLTGSLVFVGMPRVLELFNPPYSTVTTLLLLGINIHHFFIDGVVWKLSNPVVRDDIFSHLQLDAQRQNR